MRKAASMLMAAAAISLGGLMGATPAPPSRLPYSQNPSGKSEFRRVSYGRGHIGSKKAIDVTWRRHKNRLSAVSRKKNQRIAKGHAT